MASSEDKKFEARWQAFHFQEKNSKDEPKRRVEALRGLLQQVTVATNTKMLSPMAGFDLYLEKYDGYATAMDSTEEEGGVNNYADSILKSLSGHGNKSKEWSSSLTDQSRLASMPCVQKFLMDTQKASRHLLPPNHENLRLDLKDTASEDQENFKKLLSQRELERERIKRTSNLKLHSKQAVSSAPPYQGSSGTAFGQYRMDSAETQHRYPPSTVSQRLPTPGAPQRHSTPSNAPTRYPPPSVFSGGPSRPAVSGASTYRRGEPLKRKQQYDDEDEDDENENMGSGMFKTAKEQLVIDQRNKYRNRGGGNNISSSTYGTQKKSLGTRRGINSKFVPPVMTRDEEEQPGSGLIRKALAPKAEEEEEEVDERLKNIDPKMVEVIMNEIMDHGAPVTWDDIAGLDFAKKTIKEIVVWPMLRPDIFTGLRGPPKGLLLFGPPGTGKTLIGKCIASQSKSTFFSISASSLTSKWIGEGEKMVRALFAVARVHQPAVIFIDEIDSLLAQRSSDENEASRRIKTEFLVQLDGATTGEADRILVVGATNRPQEIDEAARRRFVKRLYIPLPEASARQRLVQHLMAAQSHHLTEQQLHELVQHTDGYSGADMANLCREAALGPIRSVAFEEIENIAADQVRPILYEDFVSALKQVRASVSQDDLTLYIDWNKQYGSWAL